MKGNPSKVYTQALFRKITSIFSVVLVIMGLIASYMAYDKESAVLQSRLEQTMGEIKNAYESTSEDFWRVYMPILTSEEDTYAVLRSYFLDESDRELTPIEKNELMKAMQVIMAFNHGVDWMGVYAGEDCKNYYLFEGDAVLREMTEDFPYWQELQQKGAAMEVYGSELLQTEEETIRTFALCGNATINLQDGKLIFGYRTDSIDAAYTRWDTNESVRFYITNEHGVIFDSTGVYDESMMHISEKSGAVFQHGDEWLKLYRLPGTGSKYSIFCTLPWQEAVFQGHTFSPYIFAIVVLFLIVALIMYQWTGRRIMGKIDNIQTGLRKIGENELNHRIPVPEMPTDEFEKIGNSINEMTARLQKNINRTYELRLKQKEAELAELQAKFDPHFLYNTLEVIRGKVYENGDEESAEIIIKMAKLFRSLISSESIVTIRDEVDFCSAYLALMEYRYDDRVEVVYDIDSDIMEYGIIRNLLQPVLENFFVHGIDESREKYTLKIRGKIYDEENIWFYVQDNGAGISEDKLKSLMESLENDDGSTQSYGLKNVHRRIRLFYGPGYGLLLKRNSLGGVTVELKIKRLSCEAHELRLYESPETL